MASKKQLRMSKDGPAGKGLKQGVTTLGKVVAGNPVESARRYFTDHTGRTMTGVWECQKGTLKLSSYRAFDEFCHILAGEVHHKPARQYRDLQGRHVQHRQGLQGDVAHAQDGARNSTPSILKRPRNSGFFARSGRALPRGGALFIPAILRDSVGAMH